MASKEPVPDEKVFDNFFGRLAMMIDPYHEADPLGVMLSLEGFISALLGVAPSGGPRVAGRTSTMPMVIWPLLIGKTGGFKGQSTDAAQEIMNLAVPGFDQAFVKAGFDSGLAVIEELAGRVDETTQTFRPLCVTEEEMSKVVKALRGDPRLGPAFCKVSDGKATRYASGKGIFEVAKPWVAWIGHMQPRHYKDLQGTPALDTGIWNRFVPAYVKQSKDLPTWGDSGDYKEVQAEVAAMIMEALPFAWAQNKVKPTPGPADVWEKHHKPLINSRKNKSDDIAVYGQRIQAYVMRLSALYAIFDGRTYITERDFDSATALGMYAFDTIEYVLNDTGKGSSRTRLAEKVLKHVKEFGPCSYSSVRKHCGGTLDKATYVKAFYELRGDVILYTLNLPGRGHQNPWYLCEDGDMPDDGIPLNIKELSDEELQDHPDGSDVHGTFRVSTDAPEEHTVEQVFPEDDQEDEEPVVAEIIEEPQPPLQPVRAIAPPRPPKTAPRPAHGSTGARRTHPPIHKEGDSSNTSDQLAGASSGPNVIDGAGWF